MKKLIFLIGFILINTNVFCLVSDTTEGKWQKGYIVLKTNPDTIRGYLQIKLSRFDLVTKVKFRTEIDKMKGTITVTINNINNISADTIKYFGIGSRNYKYLNYGDFIIQNKNNSIRSWVEIIELGPIEISKGFHIGMRGNGTSAQDSFTPAYYLSKTNSIAIIVAAPTIDLIRGHDFMVYDIDKKNKEHFISYISDDEELSERIRNKKLQYGDIEGYVKEYNTNHKSKH